MPFPELLLVPNEHEYAGDVRTHHLAQRAGVCRPSRQPAAVANRLVWALLPAAGQDSQHSTVASAHVTRGLRRAAAFVESIDVSIAPP